MNRFSIRRTPEPELEPEPELLDEPDTCSPGEMLCTDTTVPPAGAYRWVSCSAVSAVLTLALTADTYMARGRSHKVVAELLDKAISDE